MTYLFADRNGFVIQAVESGDKTDKRSVFSAGTEMVGPSSAKGATKEGRFEQSPPTADWRPPLLEAAGPRYVDSASRSELLKPLRSTKRTKEGRFPNRPQRRLKIAAPCD